MEQYAIFLALVCINGVLVEADIEHCDGAMPRVKQFVVPRMDPGGTAQIQLSMEYNGELRITWIKSVKTAAAAYGDLANIHRVPMLPSSDYVITNSRSGNVWSSVIYIPNVKSEDSVRGRFQAKIDVLHPCNTLTMYLDVNARWINVTDSDITVRVKIFPIWSNRVHLGETPFGGLKVEYESQTPVRGGDPLSTSKWTRYISRPGVTYYLFVLDDLQSGSQNRSGNFFTERSSQRLSDTKFMSYSNISLKPFLPRDQGVFRTKFTYNIGRTITANVYVFMELQYSDRLGAALKVKSCSSNAVNEPDEELLQLPVEAGYDNCIECFAHGAPLPKIYLAKINPDLSTGITFLDETTWKVYGHMTKSAKYLLPKMRASQEQHYVCTAGRKEYVSSLVFKLVAFTKVKITESRPELPVNLREHHGPLDFNCKASGFPRPSIKFYRTPKNSDYEAGLSLENHHWQLINADERITIYESFNRGTNTLSAMLTLPDPQSNYDYVCFARNQFSSDLGRVRVDDY